MWIPRPAPREVWSDPHMKKKHQITKRKNIKEQKEKPNKPEKLLEKNHRVMGRRGKSALPSSGRPQAYQISCKAWATSSLPTQEKRDKRYTQGEGQGGISPSTPSSHPSPAGEDEEQGQWAFPESGGTLLSPGSPPTPLVCAHSPNSKCCRDTFSQTPCLPRRLLQSLVRQRLWGRTGGLGTELWSAWAAPARSSKGEV